MPSDAGQSIFNKRATEKLRTPDDLDKYIRVTNPNVWVALAACVALVAGLLAWGVFGAVSTSVTAKGVVLNGEAMCFLPADQASKVHVGDVANVNGTSLTVAEVATLPESQDEVKQILSSDYLVSSLLSDNWAYQVVFKGDASELMEGVPLSVYITTERIAPISLILDK